MCLLGVVKKIHCQENNNNIIYFTKCFSDGNYDSASEIGNNILLSTNYKLSNEEKLRLLHNTLLAYAYSSGLNSAYNFIVKLEKQTTDNLIANYIKLYKATFSINIGQRQRAKNIFKQLLDENDSAFLHDSVKAKIYHNLSVIYSYEEKRTLQLDYMTRSYELEKKLLKNYPNYSNFNLSTDVYATTLYDRYKQFEKANEVFKDALNLPFNKNISIVNHSLYEGYVDFLINMGFESKAKHYFKLLEEFYQSQSPYLKKDLAKLYLTTGSYYADQNNFTNAILYINKALAIIPLNKETLHTRYNSLNSLSGIYHKLGQNEQSIYYMLRCIEECKNINQRLLAIAYTAAANMLARQYKDELAYAYIDSAKHLYYNTLKLPINLRFENNLAWSYFRLAQFNQSLFHYERVTLIMQENSNYTNYAIWDNTFEKAQCHLKLKNYEKAEEFLREANTEMLSTYPHLLDLKSNAHASRFGKLYRSINISLAQCLYEQFKTTNNITLLKQAMTFIHRADKALEYLRNNQKFDRDRLVTGETFYDFTLSSTKVTMALYHHTKEEEYLHKAFEFVQKGKSYALLQGINDKKYKLNSGVPLKLINELNHFKERYDFYEQRYNNILFSEEKDSILLTQLGLDMSHKMAKIDSINDLIRKTYPTYSKLKKQTDFIDINEIQNRLSTNQVVIDYYQTKKELFRFTIDKKSYLCDIISINDTFQHNLSQVVEEISSPFIGQKKVSQLQEYAGAAHGLYQVLLGDISHIIEGKELIIVPHAQLSYLPFETLLTEDYSNKKPCFKTYPWLLKKQSVTYSYNTALLPNYKKKPSMFEQVMAFAPQYTGSSSTDSIDLSFHQALDSILSPLKGAIKELQAINKLFKSDAYIGSNATKDNFIRSMQNNDILHLAMHSLNDEIQPFNSQMVFSSTDSTTGSFMAKEIYNYAISSPLTVLSSCSTGSGQGIKGEGLLSIARAFTYAGVEAQIMTLWPVNDESGANLIERFYKQLKSGQRKDVALRQSKINYLNSAGAIKSHPYYWANYVLSGNTNPVKQKTPTGTFIYLLAFALISVILFYYIDKRKRS